MHDKLMSVVNESGLWEGSQRESHAFLLSPSVYQITPAQKQELELLGFALYDCLAALSHMGSIAFDRDLNYSGVWARVRRIFSTGVPKVYQSLQGVNIKHLPRLLKVDLMVDLEGCFKIAEIDGHNKHGLGYSTLARRSRVALYPDAVGLPGAVKTLADEAKCQGYTEVKLLYADQERFYLPEFLVAKQEFALHGIECYVVSEMDADTAFVQEGLFLDLPFLYHRTQLYSQLIEGYCQGRVEFVIPPKPFLGAKTILGFLRNDTGDPQIEALLATFVKHDSLERVRRFIPETLLVGKQAAGVDAITRWAAMKRYVLKESISSGMKGTVFSDDPSFQTVLQQACATNMNWILQEEVENLPQSFSWYENRENTPVLCSSEDWFMRVTVHYVNRTLADIVVTARRDKAVHGAKDSIQIGVIVR
jgi:hypothetical protein